MFNVGDVVVRIGDVSTKMYFLRQGGLHVVVFVLHEEPFVPGTVEVRAADMKTVWDTMGPGAFFGLVVQLCAVAVTKGTLHGVVGRLALLRYHAERVWRKS